MKFSVSQRVLALTFFLVSVLVPVAAAVWRIAEWMWPPLPVLGRLPEFSLVSEEGQSFGTSDLRGRPWVANFIFTRCRGVCPALTEHMRAFAARCDEAKQVRLVSFSVDPRHDTPEALRQYARERGAIDPRWTFVTGQRDDLYALITQGFRLAVHEEAGRAEEPIVHSERFVLVDRQLNIRGYYHGLDRDELRRLCTDLGRVVRESTQG